MNKILIAAASVLATASVLAIPTAPVSAAQNDAPELMAKLSDLDQRISAAQEKGVLSKNDAAKYGKQIDDLEKTHARYSLDGVTSIEHRDLSRKIGTLKAELARVSNNRV